ncbi:major facilitator superfamily domain-containing protein [Pyronema domesticum]|uniref:Similar to Protein HOL1 acc. no. P53389 n=1 Tax=Pyronema omphalodes (strain CBS 100304) TaxID=1076935 RepID=U4L9V6_PYROM|nr:major facilitator superfamily domain-containing protein [Pyronema domesticum]CCX15514.1 Similar to Protein HOL1; acc. no. P53389 [Pyronema omphalodes CBS 100304]
MGFFGRNTLGVLDAETDEVPGTILLLSQTTQEPLGLDAIERKRTADGIILEPQPDEDPNDPLNWPSWRRDCALIALGWHCLVGGGQTPVLAAGFKDVSETFGVTIPEVALTTGLYMLGLGIGCVISSPTALIYGKRPVYLAGVVLFLAASVWAAASKSYVSLVLARIIMGIGVAPCESLPSATIAEIFFLHERAYRIGIYTLLLLGGKNLVPLVSAVIIQAKGWRWVFWIVAIIVGFNLGLLYFFVPETFWDRTPRPKTSSARPSFIRRVSSSLFHSHNHSKRTSTDRPRGDRSTHSIDITRQGRLPEIDNIEHEPTEPHVRNPHERHATFAEPTAEDKAHKHDNDEKERVEGDDVKEVPNMREVYRSDERKTSRESLDRYVRNEVLKAADPVAPGREDQAPAPIPFKDTLKLYNGKQQKVNWFKAAFRPFVLFAYPAILWSTVVYALSVGWLIVLSESVAHIYQENPYNFSALGTGLVYLSPFIGGVIGTAVAGKVSDVMVQFMCRRNAGIYEPEFRLIMGIPVALSTAIGLMGFGWSAEAGDKWIVPTVFFGIISFGCSLGSTTAITFAVDSYRQYAGEALVTLNFSKNVLHGFVFSLFFNHWLEEDGAKKTFVALGAIQMGCLLFTIPLYMYGKRLRLWTYKKRMMDKF